MRNVALDIPEAEHVTSNLVGTLRSCLEREDPPLCLAFSGGVDSALLALAGAGLFRRAVTLVSAKGRDARLSAEAAGYLGLEPERLPVDDALLLGVIARHRNLLADLPDHTQRILAVCEILLCEAAAAAEETLVTGHGPEAVLGGFARRPLLDLDDRDGIAAAYELNRTRLDRVASATACRLILPFHQPAIRDELMRFRGQGGLKADLVSLLPEGFPVAEPKSSLQNGSGVHYLFARLARANGCRLVRDYWKVLLA